MGCNPGLCSFRKVMFGLPIGFVSNGSGLRAEVRLILRVLICASRLQKAEKKCIGGRKNV